MATATTNLGLTKPEIDDNVDITIFNNNFDIIDNAINSGTGGSSGEAAASEDVVALQETVVGIQDDIQSIESSVSLVQSSITTAQNKVAALESARNTRFNDSFERGFTPYEGGVLTMYDDDGSIQFWNNHVPLYKARGLTATFAIVACRALTPIGITTSGDPYEAMSMEQCLSLTRDGFDPQSHTWSHARSVFNRSYNSGVTEAQIDEEYRKADTTFRQNGIDYNCMTFPWGANTEAHLRLARRYSKYGVNCRGTNGLNYPDTDPMDLNRLSANTGSSNLQTLKNAIDTAISDKLWLIILTHANNNQPSADALGQLLDYAIASGIRIENFREAARLKAPAFYAGSGSTAFRVMPNGETSFTMTDESLAALISKAYSIGLITSTAVSIISIAATWTGDTPVEGDTLNKSNISVVATKSDDTTQTVTNFTIDESNLILDTGVNTFTIRYGSVTTPLSITCAADTYSTIGTFTTTTSSIGARDRVWFAKSLAAGTYNLKIVLSEPIGAETSTVDALYFKTASYYGDINGITLMSKTILQLQGVTTITGTYTLTENTDGFYIFAKFLKAGILVTIKSEGEISDSDMPMMGIVAQPSNVSAIAGEISGQLTVGVEAADSSTITYQWYSNTTSSNSNGTIITGANSSSMSLDTALTAGTYYYYCVASVAGQGSVTSDVATVTVTAQVTYLAKYTMVGADNDVAPTTILDESGNGNNITVTGISNYDSNGRLMISSTGQMMTLNNLNLNGATNYNIHMKFSGKNNAQNRYLVLSTNDIHWMIYGGTSSGSSSGIQIESSAASPGFASPIQTSLVSPAIYRTSVLRLEMDITVSGDNLALAVTMRTGSPASTFTQDITIEGFTAALCNGLVYLGNRADGNRMCGMGLIEFWITE